MNAYEHLKLALEQIQHDKENRIVNCDFDLAATFRDVGDLVKKAMLKLPLSEIWTEEQCVSLNASQNDEMRHPYTCGNDSRHKPLVATPQGWICPDCEYRQFWSHETERCPRPKGK